MTRRGRLVAGILAIVTGLVALVAIAPGARAQVPGQPTFDVNSMPGLQAAVNRVYTGDLAALYLGPTGNEQASGPTFFSVSATVARFDTTAHADAALQALQRQYSGSNRSLDAFHLKPARIDKIGDGAFAFSGATKLGSIDGTLGIVIARTGRYLQTATGFAMGADPVPQLAAMVTAMSHLKPGGAVTTSSDGLHAGGIWSMLPLDQGIPPGVQANMDIQIYPAARS